MPNTRRKNYTLAKKEERKKMLEDLDQSRSDLMNEEETMDLNEKLKQQKLHIEKIMEHVKSMTDYIEVNENKVQYLEEKIQELQSKEMVDLEKNDEELHKKIDDLNTKLNTVERTQDEKRCKEIQEVSEKVNKNIKVIQETTSDLKTAIGVIRESEKLMSQGIGQVHEIPTHLKEMINEYLGAGLDTIYETINNEQDKEQLKSCVAAIKELSGQNAQLAQELKEIKAQQKEEAKLQLNLEKERDQMIDLLKRKLEELEKNNEELEAEKNAQFEKIESLETKILRMSRSSQVRFETEIRKSNARASTEIRDGSPVHSPERVNSRRETRERNTRENTIMNTLNSSTIVRSHQQRLVAPTFNGKDRPLRYLNEMRRYLDAINADYENLRCILPNSLSGPALDWWDIIENQVDSFADYECVFKERFWSDEAVEEIRRKIDTGRYFRGGKTSRVEYTTGLISQAKDIDCYSEAELVRRLAQHHDMQILLTVKTQKIATYSQLIEILQCQDQAEKRERQFHENRAFQKWTPSGDNKNFSKDENTYDGFTEKDY